MINLLRERREVMKGANGKPVGVVPDALWVPTCSSVEDGDMIVRCECGRYRAAKRRHGQ